MINEQDLELRKSVVEDLEYFFNFQLDAEANYLAAFTAKDPNDKAAYLSKYGRLVQDPSINMKTIIYQGKIIGSISKFEIEGDAEITYWIDKAFWGKGIVSMVLKVFLTTEPARPIFGRVAFDNFGSQRVLEKANFVKIGTDSGYANARQAEIVEFIYKLDA